VTPTASGPCAPPSRATRAARPSITRSACCSCGSGTAEAVTELETAGAAGARESARYGYAVALHGTGRPAARQALARVLSRHPYDVETLSAALTYAMEQGDTDQALVHARRLAELQPENAEVRRLVERLTASGRQ
jgi:Flp pilus assembly protein TadD